MSSITRIEGTPALVAALVVAHAGLLFFVIAFVAAFMGDRIDDPSAYAERLAAVSESTRPEQT